MGCSKKQRPAAERQREVITGWIGFLTQPERVLTWSRKLCQQELGKSSYGYEKVDAGCFPVTVSSHGKPRRWSPRPSNKAQEPCAVKVARTVPRGGKCRETQTYPDLGFVVTTAVIPA